MAQYNNDKAPTHQTFGYASRNNEMGTCLAVKYFDTTVAVGIHLPLPGQENEEYPKYDYKNGAMCYLQARDCKAIAKRGRKTLEKYEETGEFEGFAIPLKTGLIEFATARELKGKLKGLTAEVDPDDICAVIYTNMNEKKQTDIYMVHVFLREKVIKNYNPEAGGFDFDEQQADFDYFLDAMHDYAKAATGGYSHVHQNNTKYTRQKFERMAFALAMALGVDLSQGAGKPRSGLKPPAQNWGGNTMGSREASNPPTTTRNQTVNSEEDVESIIQQMMGQQ